MANLPSKVKPGEVITAKFINELIDSLADLNQRLGALESGTPGGGENDTPAIGLIRVNYKSSPNGIQLVPGNTAPYHHIFTLINQTNQTLTIQIQATVTAPHGTWINSTQTRNLSGASIRSLTVAANNGTQDFVVAVTPPANAVIGEQAFLNVTVSVGSPHDKQAQTTLQLNIAAQSGESVTRSIRFAGVETTPNLNNAKPGGEMLSFKFGLRYASAEAPNQIDARFTVKLSPSAGTDLSEWIVDPPFFDVRDTEKIDDTTYQTRINLNADAATDELVTFRLFTPINRGAADKIITLIASVDSIDLTPQLSESAPSPFTIRVAKN